MASGSPGAASRSSAASTSSAAAGSTASAGTRQQPSAFQRRRPPGSASSAGLISSGAACGPSGADGSHTVSSSAAACPAASPTGSPRLARAAAIVSGSAANGCARGARDRRAGPDSGVRAGSRASSAHRQSAPRAQIPWMTSMSSAPRGRSGQAPGRLPRPGQPSNTPRQFRPQTRAADPAAKQLGTAGTAMPSTASPLRTTRVRRRAGGGRDAGAASRARSMRCRGRALRQCRSCWTTRRACWPGPGSWPPTCSRPPRCR